MTLSSLAFPAKPALPFSSLPAVILARLRTALPFIACLFSQLATSGVLLHEDDWEAGSSQEYLTTFGTTAIVAPTGAFDSRSLAFNTAGNEPNFYYDQIAYWVGSHETPHTSFRIGFDLLTDSHIGSSNRFSVLLATPTTRNIEFNGDGTVNLRPGWAPIQTIATVGDGEKMRIDMRFDVALNHWDIGLNGDSIYSGSIDNVDNPNLRPADSLRSVRFSYGLEQPTDPVNQRYRLPG